MEAEAIDLLRSIDANVKLMLSRASSAPAALGVADDRDLDSQYGDPIIKAKDPRDWTGEPQKGKRFSQCPPEYLDQVAERLDFFAKKAEENNSLTAAGKPVAPFNRKDAARARGWAQRIRNGYKPTVSDEVKGWADSVETAMKAASPWARQESVIDDQEPPF
jgi:hypothetical protein